MITTTTNKASDKQIAFASRLATERILDETLMAAFGAIDIMTKREASTLIDLLMAAPRLNAPTSTSTTAAEATPEGIHCLDGVIYKVQIAVHGSGRPYAKRLVEIHEGRCPGHLRENDPSAFDAPLKYHQHASECDQWISGEWGFEYAPGVVRNLGADTLLTLEEARQFGALYGTCCVCGRTLTNEESIGYGIGPVCRKGFSR